MDDMIACKSVSSVPASEQMAPKVAKSVDVWQFLPFDIVVEILSKLPVKSLVRFRCVCRQWSSLTYDPYFINKHLHRVPSCLSFINRRIEYNDIKLYDFVKDGTFAMRSSYKIRIKQQEVYVMSNIVHGLMCVYGLRFVDTDLFLLNPFTRESAELLPIRKNSCSYNMWDNFGFGYDVTTGKYKLVRLFLSPDLPKNTQGCEIQTLGTQEWRYLGEVPCLSTSAHAVYLDGAIYWEGVAGLLSFDVKQEKFAIISNPPHNLAHSHDQYDSYLYGLAGHLYLLRRDCTTLHLKIWLMNDFGLWINLYDIDASSVAGSSCSVKILNMEDGKVLLVLLEYHRGKFTQIFLSYDTRSKTFLKLYDKEDDCGWFALCSDSLISPRKLIENVAPL